MKSLLIKDTTQEERQKIVNDSLGVIAGQCDGCMERVIDMYDDYIYGKKELREINASFRSNYVKEDDDRSSLHDGPHCAM